MTKANTYTGETDINAGELRIGSGGSIASGSTIYLGNGGTTAAAQLTLAPTTGGLTLPNSFQVNALSSGSDYTKRTIAALNTSGNNTFSGTITLAGDVSLNAASGGSLTLNTLTATSVRQVHSVGAGTMILSGSSDNLNLAISVDSGTVQLAKSSSSSVHSVGGGLTINSGGTVQLAGTGGDQIYDSSSVTVNSGGAFDLNGLTETINTISLNGSGINGMGALTNSSASAATLTLNSASTLAGATTVGGTGDITISGGGAITMGSQQTLTKIGNNKLTLSSGSADNVNLLLTANAGTVVLNKTSSSSVHCAGSLTVNNGGNVQLSGSGGYEIYQGATPTVNSGGVLDLNGQNQTFTSSGITINGTGSSSGGALINSSSTASTLASPVTLGSASSVGGTGSGGLTIAGVVSDSGGGLTKVGTGGLTLQGANTYSGGTTIKAGQVTINGTSSGTSGPLGPNTANVYLGDTTGSASATLAYLGASTTYAYPITVQSGSTGTKTLANLSSVPLVYSGSVLLNDSLTLDPGSATGSINLSGAVTGSGGIIKVNSSKATFSTTSSANQYAGNTTISQGVLQLGSATAIPNGTGKGIVTLNPTSPNTATFDLDGNNQTINGLISSGTGSAVVDDTSSTSVTLTVGTSGSNLTSPVCLKKPIKPFICSK